MNALKTKPQKPQSCPMCESPAAAHYQPFCSKRCADIDLHRWLSGSYTIPVVEDDGYVSDEADHADDTAFNPRQLN